jgi:hypothetical protein
MSTIQDRRARIHRTLVDADSTRTFKEAVTYLYYWFRFEMALWKKQRASRNIQKWSMKLDLMTAELMIKTQNENL